MKLLFLSCLLCSSFWVGSIRQSDTFRQLLQLEGTWKMQTSRGSVYESWTTSGPQQLTGKSYVLREKDTVVREQIKLEETKEGIFYIPTVSNQNQGKPVSFKLISSNESKFVFENKEHDFPQRIVYHLAAKDSIHAWIEGVRNGENRKADFYYKKVQ